MSAKIFLKPDKDKLPKRHHAWIFSGAIGRTEGTPTPGEVVEVRDCTGGFIAWGHFNPSSQIRVRLLDWDPNTKIDQEFYRRRLRQAWELRKFWVKETTGLRVVFSEGDGLPGLILDQYGTIMVLQLLTAGMEALRETWVDILKSEIPQLTGIYEKSDGDGRRQEGLMEKTGWLWGQTPGETWEIVENDLKFNLNLGSQKTGYYTDQRLNRLRVQSYAGVRQCADVFSFAGGFTCHLLAGGAASVTLCDGSQDALDLAEKNIKLNGFPPQTMVCGDAFTVLRDWKQSGKKYGLIVLDPPKLVNSKGGMDKGLKAYKDLNLQAMLLLETGGILATFSCSGLVSRQEFIQCINYAAKDSGRKVQVLEHLSQGPDHPVLTSHPEGEYLKGLILRVI